MQKFFWRFAVLAMIFVPFSELSAQYKIANICPACDIVKDGAFYNRDGLIGHYVYFYEKGKFTRVDIIDVDYSSGKIRWSYNNKTGWDYATNYYTELAMNMIKKDLDTANVGLAGACAIAEKAYQDNNLFVYAIMRNACCNSDAAKTFGADKSPICN